MVATMNEKTIDCSGYRRNFGITITKNCLIHVKLNKKNKDIAQPNEYYLLYPQCHGYFVSNNSMPYVHVSCVL